MRLSNEEMLYLKNRIHKDEELQKFLESVFTKKRNDISLLQIDSNNWSIKRAFKDGQTSELDALGKLLRPKENVDE